MDATDDAGGGGRDRRTSLVYEEVGSLACFKGGDASCVRKEISKMAFNSQVQNTFTEAGILASAPRASGVYGIFNQREWIYIGESADMEARLLEHVKGASDQSSCIWRRSPTGFACEPCPAQSRLLRELALIRELNPTCNRT